jgi:hypothetical protein
VARRTTRAELYAHTAASSLLAIAASACGGLVTASEPGTGGDGSSTLADGSLADVRSDGLTGSLDDGLTLRFDASGSDGSTEESPFDANRLDARPDALVCNRQVCTSNGCSCCAPDDAALECCCVVPPYGGPPK